jgi:RNA polymerase sigma factor (sigma-70 family)
MKTSVFWSGRLRNSRLHSRVTRPDCSVIPIERAMWCRTPSSNQSPATINGHAVEWLFTVCRHRALDVMRKEGRMKRFEEGQVERVTAAEPRPGRALEQAETQAAILRMIDRLPPNQQEVVRLKFQNGFSYKEISRITALSVTNVGFLIHTAVARLRTEFAAQRP